MSNFELLAPAGNISRLKTAIIYGADAVYAGGDAVTGAATVISAMGAGKTAANAIDEYLKKKNR